jgi:hypothetical protein
MKGHQMIGQVNFQQMGRERTAVLTEDLHWISEDKDVESLLNQICHIETVRTASVSLARHLLYQASHRLGGQVIVRHA